MDRLVVHNSVSFYLRTAAFRLFPCTCLSRLYKVTVNGDHAPYIRRADHMINAWLFNTRPEIYGKITARLEPAFVLLCCWCPRTDEPLLKLDITYSLLSKQLAAAFICILITKCAGVDQTFFRCTLGNDFVWPKTDDFVDPFEFNQHKWTEKPVEVFKCMYASVHREYCMPNI